MKTLDTYLGIEPFTVLVDDSPQLRALAARARGLRELPFPERLEAVKRLALDAMVNAYEQMIVSGNKTRDSYDGTPEGLKALRQENAEAFREHQRYKDIVFQKHPLSHALEQEAGCCRYQGALFFVLGYEADLGDRHFVHAAPVNSRANTVFNEVVQDGQPHIVSIFTDSLKDKALDYSQQNPRIFEQAFERFPGENCYSYHRTPRGLVLVENPERHVKSLGG